MSWGETLFLKKIIQGQKKLGASDAVYSVISSSSKSGDVSFGHFVPNVDGNIRLIVSGGSTSHTSPGIVRAVIDETYYSIVYDDEFYVPPKHIDIEVKKGDNILIEQVGKVETNSIVIGASLIDATLGEFIKN